MYHYEEQKKIHNAIKAESEVVSDKIMSLQRRHNKLQYTKQELLEAVMDNRMSRQDYVENKKILLADEENIAAKLAVLQQKFEELSACNEPAKQAGNRKRNHPIQWHIRIDSGSNESACEVCGYLSG